jgi:Flp pilus assembly protein TadD
MLKKRTPPRVGPNVTSQEHLAAAMDRFAADDLDGAIAAVTRALEADPASADAHEMLGEFCKHAGRIDDAIAAARKLVELDPTSVMGHVNLSRYYMLKGDKTTAEEWQEKAGRLPVRKPPS